MAEMRGAEFKVGRNLTGRRDWLGGIIAAAEMLGRNARARKLSNGRIHCEFGSMDHGIRVVMVM